MKTAIYIEDGIQQIILQPENEFERNILRAIKERENKVEFYYGSFGLCEGGWVRRYGQYGNESYDKSLMLVIKEWIREEEKQ